MYSRSHLCMVGSLKNNQKTILILVHLFLLDQHSLTLILKQSEKVVKNECNRSIFNACSLKLSVKSAYSSIF